MAEPAYDVFISYRRAGGSELAQLVRAALTRRGYRVFMDVRELAAGPFDAALKASLERATNVVVLLTPGCLERCASPGDWLRQEISLALSGGGNVVPLRTENFVIPKAEELPEDISRLAMHNCVTYVHEHSDASLNKLCGMLRPSPRMRRRRWTTGSVVVGAVLLALLVGWFASRPRDSAGTPVGPNSASATRLPPLALYWYGFGQRMQDGAWREFAVQDGMTMHDGDQFRLVFSPSADCYAYVLAVDPAGQTSVLFPNEAIRQSNQCQANRHYEIPDGVNWFTLDETTGSEMVYLVASYDPLDNVEQALGPSPGPPSGGPGESRIEIALRSLEAGQPAEPRTRDGRPIDVRGVTIKSDERLAKAQLADGRQASQVMEFVLGNVHVVKRIRFEHRPPRQPGEL
jgi:hypothetical protein